MRLQLWTRLGTDVTLIVSVIPLLLSAVSNLLMCVKQLLTDRCLRCCLLAWLKGLKVALCRNPKRCSVWKVRWTYGLHLVPIRRLLVLPPVSSGGVRPKRIPKLLVKAWLTLV